MRVSFSLHARKMQSFYNLIFSMAQEVRPEGSGKDFFSLTNLQDDHSIFRSLTLANLDAGNQGVEHGDGWRITLRCLRI